MRSKLTTMACLFLATMVSAQWSDPVLLDSNDDTVGINTLHKEWCPFVTADGQDFYFAREGAYNNDIFVCHRVGQGWSEPQMLPFCTQDGDERNPSVNATNDTLYFITFSSGWHIWWSFRTGPCDTCWGVPQRLPAPINSSGIEFSVWCTPDNQRLLFSSARPGGNGGEDIYQCRRDSSTETGWSAPLLLPGALNSWESESYPSMGLDTTELFLWRDDAWLYTAQLSDSGWGFGTRLPDNINRIIQLDPSEETPCITPDGSRLYFKSRWNGDSTATSGDIWYTDRVMGVPEYPRRRLGGASPLRIYPNPSSGSVRLESSVPLQWVTVFNVLGESIVSYPLKPEALSVSLDFSNQVGLLPAGVYWVRATGRTRTYVIPLHFAR